jgi:ribose-phosphate pyrophosphokinase
MLSNYKIGSIVEAKKIFIVPGNSFLEQSKEISETIDVQLIEPNIKRFDNGEIYCRISESVRGSDVFIIQSLCRPVNDNLMELLIMIDALKRASASSICVVIPHYGYARQDRKVSPRSPISAKLVADLLTVAGATRVTAVDLHAEQIQGFFNIPFDNIYSSPIFFEYIKKNINLENVIIVSPDAGGVTRARHYGKFLKCDIAMIDKRRIHEDDNKAKAMNVIGDVSGKDVIIIDDIIDTAGTLIEAVKAIKDSGANKIICCATHGMFSGEALTKINECNALSQIITTDSIPPTEKIKNNSKIEVLKVSKLLSQAIIRTFNNDSISSLFVS